MHHVPFVGSYVVKQFNFNTLFLQGWLSSYNQRALLVRVLMNKRNAIEMPQDTNKLKFYTRDSSSPMYTCGRALDMGWEDFIEHTKRGVKGFEYFQNIDDSWKEINSCLRKGDFKYKADESGLYTWTSTDVTQEVDRLSIGSLLKI